MLRGRVALVTGGASGIGRAIALRLAEEGAHICLLSLSRDRVQMLPGALKYFPSASELEQTRKAIEGLASRCLAIEGDISVTSDVARMVATALDELGRLDILVTMLPPKRISIKGRDGNMHDNIRMWTYWCLQEGTLGVDPDLGKLNMVRWLP